jgi:uncharacterized membrane protein
MTSAGDPHVEIDDAARTPAPDPDVEIDDERLEVLRSHARVIAATGDPDTPLTAAHAFRPPPGMTPLQGLALLAAMMLVLLSGLASGLLVDTLGVRTAAALLLAVALFARRELGTNAEGVSTIEQALLFGALVAALLLGSKTALAMIPAVVHAAVARMMIASAASDDVPLIERGARIAHPLAPRFIGPYCRKLTAVWGFFFAVSAGVTGVLALAGSIDAHRAWTGWQLWALLGLFSVAELFWRKAWFRYFGKGPFDRLLARVFPPEKTERGRRSQAYLLRMRAELARLAEMERTATSRAD